MAIHQPTSGRVGSDPNENSDAGTAPRITVSGGEEKPIGWAKVKRSMTLTRTSPREVRRCLRSQLTHSRTCAHTDAAIAVVVRSELVSLRMPRIALPRRLDRLRLPKCIRLPLFALFPSLAVLLVKEAR